MNSTSRERHIHTQSNVWMLRRAFSAPYKNTERVHTNMRYRNSFALDEFYRQFSFIFRFISFHFISIVTNWASIKSHARWPHFDIHKYAVCLLFIDVAAFCCVAVQIECALLYCTGKTFRSSLRSCLCIVFFLSREAFVRAVGLSHLPITSIMSFGIFASLAFVNWVSKIESSNVTCETAPAPYISMCAMAKWAAVTTAPIKIDAKPAKCINVTKPTKFMLFPLSFFVLKFWFHSEFAACDLK